LKTPLQPIPETRRILNASQSAGLRLSLCRGIHDDSGSRLAGSNMSGARSFSEENGACTSTPINREKGEKTRKKPTLRSRGFFAQNWVIWEANFRVSEGLIWERD
jgi:hypothetical protein